MIEILIVDDNPFVRESLRAVLDGLDDTRVVGEASDGHQALQLAARLRPTVILLDHRMPRADGLSVVASLSRYSPVLVLTGDNRAELVAAMLRGGARGYLVYGRFEPEDLARAIRAVAGGEAWLSPGAALVATTALRRSHGPGAQVPSLPGHTPELSLREQDVMNLLCLGLSNAAIGELLDLSEKTIKNHLHRIFGKLGVASRAEAVVRWIRQESA
jgi:DNA-binding NarL/FixJ family response regulator